MSEDMEETLKHQEYLKNYLGDNFDISTFANVTVVCADGEKSFNQIYLPFLVPEFYTIFQNQGSYLTIILPDTMLAELFRRRLFMQDQDPGCFKDDEIQDVDNEHDEEVACDQLESKIDVDNDSNTATITEIVQNKVIKCNMCDKLFNSRVRLNSHMNSHIKPFKCKFCDEKYARRDYLKRHEYNEHREYVDEDLEVSFSEGQKTFSLVQCAFCPKVLRGKSQLQIHERRHTGEKPYQCEQCNIRFTTVCNLRTHQKKHSESVGFPCKECGKQLSTNTALKDHMTIHTGERPHTCNQCGISFKRSTNLWRHNKKYHNSSTSKDFSKNMLDISIR